jgi:hypothetical protein
MTSVGITSSPMSKWISEVDQRAGRLRAVVPVVRYLDLAHAVGFGARSGTVDGCAHRALSGNGTAFPSTIFVVS